MSTKKRLQSLAAVRKAQRRREMGTASPDGELEQHGEVTPVDTWGKAFQAEGTAHAKALKQEL